MTNTDQTMIDERAKIKKKMMLHMKRTREMFLNKEQYSIPEDKDSQRKKVASKIHIEYRGILHQETEPSKALPQEPLLSPSEANDVPEQSSISKVIEQVKEDELDKNPVLKNALVSVQKPPLAQHFGTSSSTLARGRRPKQVPTPAWHAPWKLKRVISGHLGWVRAIAVDPTNDWFVTGSADRSIKIWDLASGQLKLTLTGHINCIRGLAVSPRHPYLFSAAEDKKVLCWDLEYNKVIRSYHGHLSGVFCMKLHPTLDVLITGGRDCVARVWDMRTKQQIHCLSGHNGTIFSMETQSTDPQIITGAADSTVKLWDLAAGKVMTTLTNHKKTVRAMVCHPTEYSFLTGAADNLKKWHARDGKFLRNFSGHQAVINSLSVNQDNVVVSCGDNGSMRFWDYTTGYAFQDTKTVPQPGSLDSERGIYTSAFDHTGMRLITGEADKTIKIWQEDPDATEESHPINMASWTKEYLAPKRY